jgi:hypothetical protein
MQNSHMLAEPCPAKKGGGSHTCVNCSQAIAVGAPVLDFGRHGYAHRPPCGPAAPNTGPHDASGVGDLQDQVVARLLDNRGHAGAASTDSAESFLAFCQTLGSPDPRTGLRPGQDLADAVAERLLAGGAP